jgi:hypothetical protein
MKLTLNCSVSSRMSFLVAPVVSATSALDLRGTLEKSEERSWRGEAYRESR